jgi:hypothetical protein
MKLKKYIFNDHYKKSKDVFRNILGIYFDYKNNQLHDKHYPLKNLFANSLMEFGDSVLVDEATGLHKQTVNFKPKDTEANKMTLQSFYQIEPSGNENVPPDIIAKSLDEMLNEFTNKPDIIYQDYNSIYYTISDEDSNFQDWYSKVYYKYNFYIQKYETLVNSNDVPEEILPNFYVTSLALNRNLLDSVSQHDYNAELSTGADSPYLNFHNKFDNFITLENNLVFNSDLFEGKNTLAGLVFGLVLIAYAEQYANVYDSVSINFLETAKKRFGQIFANITNKELLNKLNEFKFSYPMYSEIVWSTNSIGPLTQFLENANISLQAFQDFINNKLIVDVNSNNPYLQNIQFSILNDLGVPAFSEIVQTKQVYDIGVWISNFLDQVLNEEDQVNATPAPITFFDGPREIIQQSQYGDLVIPVFDNVADILNALTSTVKLNELLLSTTRSYKNIINGELSQSEVLFYKIEKRNQFNDLIQTFYIPNIIGLDVQTYVDTQVKFDKIYKYKIFSFTAIYGTEYYYKKEYPVELYNPLETLDLSNNSFNEGVQTVNDAFGTGVNNFESVQSATTVSQSAAQQTLIAQIAAQQALIAQMEAQQSSQTVDQQATSASTSFARNFANNNPVGQSSNSANNFQSSQSASTVSQSAAQQELIEQLNEAQSLLEELTLQLSALQLAGFAPESANQLQDSVANATIETIENSGLLLQAEEELYEHHLIDAFLNGYSFTVFYKPAVKLIELEYVSQKEGRITDFPPTPPIAIFNPIKDCSTKLYISLSPSSGEIKQRPKPIFTDDEIEYAKYLANENMSDSGMVIFKYEGEIKKYELFRIENEPENYLSFSTDTTLYTKVYENTENVLIKEEIEKNKNYFYTFRCHDFHDKFSNPSPIYKVKIYENNGVEYLDVSLYNFKPKQIITNKSFRRFLKISPTYLQNEYDLNENKMGLLDESVYNQNFIVRIKSKHTGKIIDLNIKFEKNDII